MRSADDERFDEIDFEYYRMSIIRLSEVVHDHSENLVFFSDPRKPLQISQLRKLRAFVRRTGREDESMAIVLDTVNNTENPKAKKINFMEKKSVYLDSYIRDKQNRAPRIRYASIWETVAVQEEDPSERDLGAHGAGSALPGALLDETRQEGGPHLHRERLRRRRRADHADVDSRRRRAVTFLVTTRRRPCTLPTQGWGPFSLFTGSQKEEKKDEEEAGRVRHSSTTSAVDLSELGRTDEVGLSPNLLRERPSSRISSSHR